MEGLKEKGLTGFQIKYIAMALMVLDHIYNFFEFTDKIPVWFSMLGRLSAPLFLFCIIEGFTHTHNRKKYFIQIYGIAIAMGLIQFAIPMFGFSRPDGVYPQNQMLATFAVLLVILQGIDWCAKRKWAKGLMAIIIPTILPFIAVIVGNIFNSSGVWFIINLLNYSILPLHSWIMDGGTLFILQGIFLYAFRKKRKWQALVFAITSLIYIIMPILYIPNITVKLFFTDYYEWMSAFAAILMLLYNGERGKGNKKLFYWFYPGHVYVFYSLSCLLYFMLNK